MTRFWYSDDPSSFVRNACDAAFVPLEYIALSRLLSSNEHDGGVKTHTIGCPKVIHSAFEACAVACCACVAYRFPFFVGVAWRAAPSAQFHTGVRAVRVAYIARQAHTHTYIHLLLLNSVASHGICAVFQNNFDV